MSVVFWKISPFPLILSLSRDNAIRFSDSPDEEQAKLTAHADKIPLSVSMPFVIKFDAWRRTWDKSPLSARGNRTVGELKRTSSILIKSRDRSLVDFYWQNGYGAFSVGRFDFDIVRAYTENQETHHAENTFQNEYRKILEDHEIEYDEQYVWD